MPYLTHLKPAVDFVNKGCSCICKDRAYGNGGGCAIFIREGIKYRQFMRVQKLEVIVIQEWAKDGTMKLRFFGT